MKTKKASTSQALVEETENLKWVARKEFQAAACCGSGTRWSGHICKILPGQVETHFRKPTNMHLTVVTVVDQ